MTLVRVTSEDVGGLGDITETTTAQVIENAMFDPAHIDERTHSDQAPVLQPAVFNLPGVHDVDANDRILVGAVEVDDIAAYDGPTWYVTGGGLVWLDRTKVPVSETREA